MNHFKTLALLGMLIPAGFTTISCNKAKDTPQQATATQRQTKAFTETTSCDDAEIRAAEVSAHQLTAQQADNMIANYCTTYNVSFSGFQTLSTGTVTEKLDPADCSEDKVILYGEGNGNNASIQLDVVHASSISDLLYPNTSIQVIYSYPVALFRGIIDHYGKSNIRDFQFAYGLNAAGKATILFRVRDNNSDVIYLADYSSEDPT